MMRQRSNAVVGGGPPAILVNCDLCTLSYQNYHQSAIWPLDPWYETLARGATDRRTLFMKAIHQNVTFPARGPGAVYGGPAAIGGLGASNLTLDPIVTNYAQIRPRDPAWNADGAVFLGMKAADYIVDPIRHVSVAHYNGFWEAGFPHGPNPTVIPVHDYGSGSDELIAFEGGTGAFQGSVAAWSLMGFVLKRTNADGTWTAHIVFRGSRSGNAMRAVLKSGNGLINSPEGNADWITDLATGQKQDTYVGGKAAVGFVDALKRCWGTLRRALLTLDGKYGAPTAIHVAGHSLGAALAALCCASISQVALGAPGHNLRQVMPAWPWSRVQGFFYAVPPVGSEDFCAKINREQTGLLIAPYVADDMVVECSKSVSMRHTSTAGFAGWFGAKTTSGGNTGYTLGALDRMPRPQGAAKGENSHELYLIRAAIIDKYCASRTMAVASRITSATCWAMFATFEDMLDGRAVSLVRGEPATMITRANLRGTLVNSGFDRHFTIFLQALQGVVSNLDSYRAGGVMGRSKARSMARPELLALAAERVGVALAMCDNVDSDVTNIICDTVATQVAALTAFSMQTTLRGRPKAASQGGIALEADALLGQDFNSRIGLGLILRSLQRKPGTAVDHYARFPELAACLRVNLGDVEKWQKQQAARRAQLGV